LKVDYLFYYTKASALKQSLEDAQAKLIKQSGLPFVAEVKEALNNKSCSNQMCSGEWCGCNI